MYDMSMRPQLSGTRDTEVGPVCLDCWYWQVYGLVLRSLSAWEGLFHVNLSWTVVGWTACGGFG